MPPLRRRDDVDDILDSVCHIYIEMRWRAVEPGQDYG